MIMIDKLFKKAVSFFIRYIYSLLSSVYLFTIGFLFLENRIFMGQIYEHFNLFKTSLKLPQIRFSELTDGKETVEIVEPIWQRGNITYLELLIINLLVKEFNPQNILEIGTFNGRTTLNLAANSSSDAKVYTIDIPKTVSPALSLAPDSEQFIDKEVIGERFLNKDTSKIVQLYGDTATFDFSPYFNKMDMVFIDGAHSFEYVMNDSKIALKLLRDGRGLILWHDYNTSPDHRGVAKAIHKLQSENPKFRMFHIKNTSLAILNLNRE